MGKKIKIFLIGLFIGIILLQFFQPDEIKYNSPSKKLTGVPAEVSNILKNSCFDCHSSGTNLRWYDKVAPASFLVAGHIREGRQALNFSQWETWPAAKQNATIYYAINKVLSGEMPLPAYTAVHSTAKLNDSQIKILKNYAMSLSPRKVADSAQIIDFEKVYEFTGQQPVNNIKKSPNGLSYFPDYRTWKAVSITDRLDNGTMRIIFGNDIAVKAIQDHNTNPWPDGSTFAKAAWKQLTLPNGSTIPGEFIQVEFMVKDRNKYAETKGWGWGRWKGTELKPYGDKPGFDRECIECHKPMNYQDYVFTSPLYLLQPKK